MKLAGAAGAVTVVVVPPPADRAAITGEIRNEQIGDRAAAAGGQIVAGPADWNCVLPE